MRTGVLGRREDLERVVSLNAVWPMRVRDVSSVVEEESVQFGDPNHFRDSLCHR